MSKFSDYKYRKQPGFDMNAFEGANQAIPMKTLVIYCFDPRAAEIPQAVARYFGNEVYPGENILDETGNRVGSTRTLFTETNAGWTRRLRSRVRGGHGLYIQSSECCCGSALVLQYDDADARAIATMFDHDSLAIMVFEKSIKYDVGLQRSSPAVPKRTK